eukprot:c2798_g1_i1.p1 GENE.c2798_g1_i1~~c2798_g1_i1.p1  ORF type:complete len:418 (+),score=63.10 c2798_g1_i1:710-1963(+)
MLSGTAESLPIFFPSSDSLVDPCTQGIVAIAVTEYDHQGNATRTYLILDCEGTHAFNQPQEISEASRFNLSALILRFTRTVFWIERNINTMWLNSLHEVMTTNRLLPDPDNNTITLPNILLVLNMVGRASLLESDQAQQAAWQRVISSPGTPEDVKQGFQRTGLCHTIPALENSELFHRHVQLLVDYMRRNALVISMTGAHAGIFLRRQIEALVSGANLEPMSSVTNLVRAKSLVNKKMCLQNYITATTNDPKSFPDGEISDTEIIQADQPHQAAASANFAQLTSRHHSPFSRCTTTDEIADELATELNVQLQERVQKNQFLAAIIEIGPVRVDREIEFEPGNPNGHFRWAGRDGKNHHFYRVQFEIQTIWTPYKKKRNGRIIPSVIETVTKKEDTVPKWLHLGKCEFDRNSTYYNV